MRIACLLSAAALLAPSVQSAQTPLAVDLVGFGFSKPIAVQFAPGDKARMFVCQQDGLILIVKNGQTNTAPFLDLRSKTFGFGERGLLGMAFHPKFESNGYFFVHYTDRSGSTMLERYTVSSSDPDVADASSDKRVYGPVSQPYSNHNGGWLAFGPDGYLWLSLGDGGSGGDPGCRAQNGQSPLGKILRFDIDTTAAYAIPPSNPFVRNPNVLDEVAHLGLRNAWRCSFDRVTGDLYMGDVGQTSLEEISFAARGQLGLNFGWKIMEGTRCFGTSNCASSVPLCNASSLVKPIHEYPRNEGRSVTGGYVYRGCAIPDYKGTYFFADYVDRRVWTFRYANGTRGPVSNVTSQLTPRNTSTRRVGQVSSFGEDNDGELYICDYSDGEIWKIVPRLEPPVKDLGYAKAGVNGLPLFDACGLLYKGQSAVFSLTNAAPNTASVLVLSGTNMPVSLFGGTLVPWPPLPVIIFPTDAAGNASFTVPGSAASGVSYAQFVIFDAAASQSWAFSNALEVSFR